MSAEPPLRVLLAAGSDAASELDRLRELLAASAPPNTQIDTTDGLGEPLAADAGYDCVICTAAAPEVLVALVARLRSQVTAPIIALAADADEQRPALDRAGAVASLGRDRPVPESLALAVRLGRAEERAARALADLAAARRAQSDFVRLVSHDMRGPLSTIHLACDALRLEIGDGPGKAYLAAAERGVERARVLLDGLLDIAGLEAGTLAPRPATTRIGGLLERVRAEHAARASQARCTLQVVTAGPDPEASLDRGLVARALGLLVAGAITRAPGGSITLSGSRQRDELVLSVQDDGPPIAPSQLPHVFAQAWHGPAGNGRLEMGAALVKAVAEAHGGRVAIISEPGAGTRIELRLPTER